MIPKHAEATKPFDASPERGRVSERKATFKEFLLEKMPSWEGVDLTRDQTPARDVDL